MQLIPTILSTVIASLFVSGCGTVAVVRDDIKAKQPAARKSLDEPFQFSSIPRVVEKQGVMLPVTEVNMMTNGGDWLKAKFVSLDAPNPITLTQVVSKLSAQGINISSDLSLDTFTFVGNVNRTDGESALRQILNTVGLDYMIDDVHQLVTIKPVSSRTWYMNIGNRKSSYSSSGVASVGGGNSTGNNGQNSSSGVSGGNSQTTQISGQATSSSPNGSMDSAGSVSVTSSKSVSGNGVSISDDFWGAMERELSKRLTVMVPAPKTYSARSTPVYQQMNVMPSPVNASIFPTPVPLSAQIAAPLPNAQTETSGGDANGLYVSKRIGSFALNPETGAITVQAPRWVLVELDAYLKRIQLSYNQDISFEGRLILITSSKSDSEGLDIQSFARWANNRYGAVISNNNLGGVTLGFPNGNIPSVNATSQSVGGALLGIVSPVDGLQIFNNYLRELGNVSVLQRPRVTTTSGVPGAFSNFTTRVYTVANQSASSGNSGSAVQATTNTVVEKEFGTELRVNPRYDVTTSCTRTLITLKNLIFAGDQSINQALSSGTTILTLPGKVPTQRKLNFEGEALLCDGDLVILGGQSEETLQSDENGLPAGDVPLSGIFGSKKSTQAVATYYFALKVNVRSRQ